MKLPVANNTITFYANTDKLYYHSDKGSVGNFFTLTTDGNIGIGTTNPSALLHLMAPTGAGSSTQLIFDRAGGYGAYYVNYAYESTYYTNGSTLEFRAGNSLTQIRLTSNNPYTAGNIQLLNGNVGIGTTNPLAKLEIKSSGDGDLFIARYSGGAAKLIYGYQSSADGFLELRTGADEIVTKLSGYSGTASYFLSKVGIGTTNPGVATDIVGNSSDAIKLRVKNTSTTGNAGMIINPEGTGGVAAGDGTIFFDMNSTAWVMGVDKSDSSKFKISNDVYGDFRGGNHFTITTAGNVGIGITSPADTLHVNGTLCVQSSSGQYGLIRGYNDPYHGLIMRGYPTTATNITDITAGDVMAFYEYGGDYRFFTKNPSSLTMHVRFNLGTIYATNTTVQSVSDIRTKENIRNSDEGLGIISALRPVRFDFKDGYNDSKKNQLGFIAQEVEEVFPDAVSEWEKEPGQIYKTMGPSALIPVLVKAVQELKAEIEVLKNK
jgi:hypothetical protein